MNKVYRHAAFSLAELMVTLAIVATLAAVAMPVYKSYSIRSKIVETMVVADRVLTEIRNVHTTTLAFPTSVKIGSVTVGTSYTTVNLGNIAYAYYSVSPDGSGVQLTLWLRGLEGIPNYVAPVATDVGGRHNRLDFALRDSNGLMQSVCGHQADPSTINNSVDFSYLPSACSCGNTNRFFTGTGTCATAN